MSSFPNKKTAFALSLSLCVTLFSHADEMDSRLSSLEGRMGAVKVKTAKGTVGAKMATARPLTDGYGFFGTAEVLFWHLQESGTDFVLKDNSTVFNTPFVNNVPLPLPGFVKGESKKVHFDWDFGYRLGAGYLFEHDEWDVNLSFTSFLTSGYRKTRTNGPLDFTVPLGAAMGKGILYPQFGSTLVPGTTIPFAFSQKARARWNVDYYVLDLELGRNFFVSKFLAMRPLFGLETAWIDQDATLIYRLFSIVNFPQRHFIVKEKNDFWGIGPQIGVDTMWYLGRHFSLLGNIKGALLWGDFDVSEKEKFTGPSGFKFTNAKGNFNAIVANIKTTFGAQWEMNFNENCNHIAIKLGYEFQYWWNQNQILVMNTELPFYQRAGVGLSINGVTLEMRVDF